MSETTKKPRVTATGVRLEALVFEQCLRALRKLPTVSAASRMAAYTAAWVADPANAKEFHGSGQLAVPGAAFDLLGDK